MSRGLRLGRAIACAAVLLAGAAAPAFASAPDFFGSWYASGPDVRGVTRIDVRRAGAQIFVRVWGRCHPVDCDWGEAPGQPYAPDVDAPVWSTADVVTAEFDTPAEHTTVLLRTNNGGLFYQTFTRFQDGSARSDYRQYGRLNH